MKTWIIICLFLATPAFASTLDVQEELGGAIYVVSVSERGRLWDAPLDLDAMKAAVTKEIQSLPCRRGTRPTQTGGFLASSGIDQAYMNAVVTAHAVCQ